MTDLQSQGQMFALTEDIEISAIFLISRPRHLAGFRTTVIAFVATLTP